MDPAELTGELRAERDAFFAALEAVAPESLTTPGLVGEWSGRDLIAHVGYWVGHATELIHRAELGRTEPDDLGERAVDEINATVARVARETPLDTVRRREAASVEALAGRLAQIDPVLLEVVLPDGASLARGIREDGAEHYREHADELRAALSGGARG
jgi:hypothetical protein